MHLQKIQIVATTLLVVFTCQCTTISAQAKKNTKYSQKEGFVRHPKDIINTLTDNTVSGFHTFLDALSQAFDLDKTLKGAGPYTVFAPDDKAIRKMPDADWQSLVANKPKLKQVLSYHIVPGKFDAETLSKMSSIKTLEGSEVKFGTNAKGHLTVNGAEVKTADLVCTNGVIHVIDSLLSPPLKK